MTPREFMEKWKPVALTERATAHSHFLDLCALLGHDDPVKADPTGEWFTFEKGVSKTGGGEGFADVWKRNHFAWEYKKKKRDLNVALDQLVRYAAALENPPLQVACDTDRIVIRTAWTNAVPKTYELVLDDLADPQKLDLLHAVFFDPEKLRPKETRAAVTKEAADKFSTIALRLQGRGSPEEIAHFVNQLVFCFFASSVKLLPDGFFPKLLKLAAEGPKDSLGMFNQLFAAMESGGRFGLDIIAYFNGGLFDGRHALPLDSGDIGLLQAAGSMDWSQIDPTIFGTLFERFLDPEKRGQIGAHYTDSDKIVMIVEPVILRPLREEWAAAKAEIDSVLTEAHAKVPKTFGRGADHAVARAMAGPLAKAEAIRSRFIDRLRTLSILDPACGSGNFLYLALQGVQDLELKANLECEALGLPPHATVVGPEIVHGIEINQLAAELARTTIWIGDIQWRIRNGIYAKPQPILRKLDAIECRDALVAGMVSDNLHSQSSPPGLIRGATPSLRAAKKNVYGLDKPGHGEGGVQYVEAQWPQAEFIVGNPPFLGGQFLRSGLGDEYFEALTYVYQGRVPRSVDLVTYWFEKARAVLEVNQAVRVGLVATQSIRRGSSRSVLDRIQSMAEIFEAWSDEEWTVDGANVRIAVVCFGIGEKCKKLDGIVVTKINSDLSSSSADLTGARRLEENLGIGFQGPVKVGPFDVSGDIARDWLSKPLNPNSRGNGDVLVPTMNGNDIVRRLRGRWIIDFGDKTEAEASLYELPFEYVREHVKPLRANNRDRQRRENWWRLGRSGADLKRATLNLRRFIVTPRVARYRIFAWSTAPMLPDTRLVAIARDDDTTIGILQSRFHESWSLRLGGWHGVGNDPQYTPTLGFETFPFPSGLTPDIPAADYADDLRAQAIAKAAKRLDELRNAWLNPPDLVEIVPDVVPTAEPRAAGAEKIYPDRILPKDTVAAATLRERTLTNLYNQRPQWLANAHRDLDAAVAAAYGWRADISEEEALAKLLELNLARAGTAKAAPIEAGAETPQPGERPILGRDRFAKISEVEGIRLSDDMKQAMAEFDRQGLPPEQRRRAIIGRFKRAGR